MTNPRSVISAEILRVHQDDLGPYAKLRVTLSSGEAIIRLGLDDYTYRHLQSLMFTQVLAVSTAPEYRCLLSFDVPATQPSVSMGWLEFQSGGQRTRHSFFCSEQYLADLQWLSRVQSIEELDGLRWEHWLEYKSARTKPVRSKPRTGSAGRRRRVRTTPSRRTWLTAGLGVGAVILSLGWLGGRLLTDNSRGQHLSPMAAAHNSLTQSARPSPNAAQPPVAQAPTAPAAPHKSASHHPAGSTPLAEHNTSANGIPVDEMYAVPSGSVALTFDDGPSPYTAAILKVLADYHVHATFFFISDNALRRPDVVRAAAAQGHVVGNHSVDHKQLPKLSTSGQTYEITHAADVISALTGQPVVLFRPPYGSFNQVTEEILRSHHMVLALWNRDPRDWAAHTPAEVVKNVLQLPASGGVFDLHDNKNTLLALPTIIEALQKQHLHFVVLAGNVDEAKTGAKVATASTESRRSR